MGLLFTILTFPYAPVRGLTAMVRALRQQAEAELHGSASVRRELEELDAAAAAGDLSETEYADAQRQILARVVAPADHEERG